MSFALSAQETRVEDGHMLRARLQKSDGEWVDAEINLNDFIGNNDGFFEWGGVNFSQSAQDIDFSVEGDDAVPVLRATLTNMEGEGIQGDINLGERIQNIDGGFQFGKFETSAVERVVV
ncbi:Cyanovirin-N [Chaetomium tenue]|uniref:Cyanovirin-N n=1 Tax=Chaetomium tenue TaxID=1854479 RepID=A0ACB7P960_9PEZI|nr:Cyanovirin-N [Chaetomium globosum]